MNLSETREFALSDIEETNNVPVTVEITRLSPEEVDELLRAAGTINLGDIAKLSFIAKNQGISLEDFNKDEMPEEEKVEKMMDLFEAANAAGIEVPDMRPKKLSAVETYNLLKEHVVGWTGVFGNDGKAFPFTPDNQKIFLAALPAFVKDKIVEAIEHLTEHGVLPGEKNSSPS